MYAAGHVGFLPENTHLMYLSFPWVPPLSTLQYKPHQICETKTLILFGIQSARQKSQALQVAPVQRRAEDRCRCLNDVIYQHTTMSINMQSPVSLTTADIKQMREQIPSPGWLLSCSIHPHLFFLGPWLGYPVRKWFPAPLFSHRVSQHMADQLRDTISFSLQAPSPHFGDLFGVF